MGTPEELERKAAKLARELADTQAELRRVRLTPAEEAEVLAQARRRRFFVIKGGAIAALLLWIWRRKPEVAIVAAISALVAVLLIGPPGSSNDGDSSTGEGVPDSIRLAPSPEVKLPEPAEAIIKMAAEQPLDVSVAPPSPQEIPTLALDIAPTAEPSAPTMLDLGPADEEGDDEDPEPPEELADEEEVLEPPPGERPEDDPCLDLDLRPVTDLGVCIRELLGLLP